MATITAIYGSPRREGNTSLLLKQAVAGARDGGALVEEIVLRDYKIAPCLEIYNCIHHGECAIHDDFPEILTKIIASSGIMLASPIFFYTVSAHTKIFMDRCQSLWVKKYWIEKQPFNDPKLTRDGLFISAGATKGAKLFNGALLTVKYFFDVLDTRLSQKLLYRELDHKGDVARFPEYLREAYDAGREMAGKLRERDK